MFKIVALCSVIALCNAGLLPAQLAYNNHQQYEEHDAPANYQFEYSVNDAHTGDVKQQQETRQGDAVQGSYSLVEPDGHRRIVQYSADAHSGFNAVIQREGTVHPQQYQAVHAAPVAVAHASPIAYQTHASPVAYQTHASPVAYQAHAAPVAYQAHAAPVAIHAAPVLATQIAHAQPLAYQSHAPVLAQTQAYVSAQPAQLVAAQPIHQLNHGYSQQVLGHGYAPAAHGSSYSTSSISHGIHGAYAH